MSFLSAGVPHRPAGVEKIGHDPAADGVNRPVSVYASAECHHTIQRSGGDLELDDELSN